MREALDTLRAAYRKGLSARHQLLLEAEPLRSPAGTAAPSAVGARMPRDYRCRVVTAAVAAESAAAALRGGSNGAADGSRLRRHFPPASTEPDSYTVIKFNTLDDAMLHSGSEAGRPPRWRCQVPARLARPCTLALPWPHLRFCAEWVCAPPASLSPVPAAVPSAQAPCRCEAAHWTSNILPLCAEATLLSSPPPHHHHPPPTLPPTYTHLAVMTNDGRADVDFRFRLSPEEAEVVGRAPHPPQSLILLGRSGTGAAAGAWRRMGLGLRAPRGGATLCWDAAARVPAASGCLRRGGCTDARLGWMEGGCSRATSALPRCRAGPPCRQDNVRRVPHV